MYFFNRLFSTLNDFLTPKLSKRKLRKSERQAKQLFSETLFSQIYIFQINLPFSLEILRLPHWFLRLYFRGIK